MVNFGRNHTPTLIICENFICSPQLIVYTSTSVQAVKFDLSSNLIQTSSSFLEPIAEKRVQSSSVEVFKAPVSDTQVT